MRRWDRVSVMGLTLVEILIVVTIVSLAFVPIFTLYRGQTLQASQASDLLAVHTYLLERLDRGASRLHATRFRDAVQKQGPTYRDQDWGKGKVQVEEWFTVRRSSRSASLYRLDVKISWDQRRGKVRRRATMQLTRLVANPYEVEGLTGGGS